MGIGNNTPSHELQVVGQINVEKSGGGTAAGIRVTHPTSNPSIGWDKENAGTNARHWDMIDFGTVLTIRAVNDANSIASELLSMSRSGSDALASTFNENSDNFDFRVESDDNANMFFIDGSTSKIGIGTGVSHVGNANNNATLTVVGNINVTGGIYYSWLQAQSPHAFINKDAQGNFKRTEICIVADDGIVVLQYLKKNGLSGKYEYIFEPNAQVCKDKEVSFDDGAIYQNMTVNDGTIEQVEVARKTKKVKLFK